MAKKKPINIAKKVVKSAIRVGKQRSTAHKNLDNLLSRNTTKGKRK